MYQEAESLKTVIFQEQVMFKDKHSTMFLRQMGATVFIIFHRAFADVFSVT